MYVYRTARLALTEPLERYFIHRASVPPDSLLLNRAERIRAKDEAVTVALAESVRRDSCPVRRSFIQRAEGETEPTPLARLLRTRESVGGKGGGLRISLLLTLIWVTARPPYSTSRVAPYWAELLGRDDPQGEGARVIRDCLHELNERGFIQIATRGARSEIVLLNESTPVDERGRPNLYQPPYNESAYVPIPRAFWTEGLAGTLSGAAVAMYLCGLALTRHDQPEFFVSSQKFEERFGISRSSRKRGIAELTQHGVISTRVQHSFELNTFRQVKRNIYTIRKKFRQPEPWSGVDSSPNPDGEGAPQSA